MHVVISNPWVRVRFRVYTHALAQYFSSLSRFRCCFERPVIAAAAPATEFRLNSPRLSRQYLLCHAAAGNNGAQVIQCATKRHCAGSNVGIPSPQSARGCPYPSTLWSQNPSKSLPRFNRGTRTFHPLPLLPSECHEQIAPLQLEQSRVREIRLQPSDPLRVAENGFPF